MGVVVWLCRVASSSNLWVVGIGGISGRGGSVKGIKIRLFFFYLL